jgi:putative phosphoribosyl transferase
MYSILRIFQEITIGADLLQLGAPSQEELAMGAVASGDILFLNDEIIGDLGVSQAELNQVIATQKTELKRRETIYRHNKPFPVLTGKNIILVDDGIATGATLRAAIIALRKLSPKKMIVAVPVAPENTLPLFSELADELICLHPAQVFYGVGAFYDDFSQTTDDEVIRLLK